MKEKFRQFLVGRYGGDGLNTVLSVISLVSFAAGTAVVACVHAREGRFIGGLLYVVALAFLCFALFRVFSRNLSARKAENEWFRRNLIAPIKSIAAERRTRRAQSATHRFFKCPDCRQTVRVPKGIGTVKITCPKCGRSFIKKT